ncbi:nitroreductase family protein [Kribbella sp. NPDC059898]|uniref:nitroreductase family protein n=1 Tax=Kribbella sp. NPDC059898 TaxID=3346995 RepID=UPI0036606483
MEFAEVLRRRRMVREFEDRSIAPELVERILASGQRGPSAGYVQGFAFLVLTEADDLRRFWPFAPNQTRYKPRVMNAPLADRASYLERRAEPRWPAPYWQIDTGMAAILMLLAAVDAGLDGFLFWLMPDAKAAYPDSEVAAHVQRFRDEFGIPDGCDPIGAIAIGHRAEDLPPQRANVTAERREYETFIHHGRW